MQRLVVVPLACLLLAQIASADLVLSMQRITSNSATDIANQLQVSVDQLNVSSDQVRFKISNLGPLSSEVAEIYWEDRNAVLANIMTLPADTSSGVGFQYISAHPGSLPAGNTIGFETRFAADEGKPGGPAGVDPGNGITPGSMAAFKFDIAGLKTYQMVEDAIRSGDLRVGLHVRSINTGGVGDGSSDSFVSAVPEPSSYLLIGLVGSVTLLWQRFVRSRLS